jgi:hypothetical protein
MRIVLDARYLTHAESGIGSYTLNLTCALLDTEKDLELLLICSVRHGRRRLVAPRVTEVLFPCPPISPLTPTGKPSPLAVRLAKALPFRRAQVEMRDALAAHDDPHTADGAHAHARGAVVSGHTARTTL